jgi:DNA adenine methylase
MALIRYPGSKERLASVLTDRLPLEFTAPLWEMQDGCEYREPFFGAGAIGFRVLRCLPPSARIWLNDIDPGIVALWTAVKERPEDLCRLISRFEPSVEAFDRFKGEDGDTGIDPLRLGFQKLALHQMSVSGFGFMSGGPLGGRTQANSTYTVESRWRPDRLKSQVRQLSKLLRKFEALRITMGDFEPLIVDAPPKCFLYLDPPYVRAGEQLYRYSMSDDDHRRLSRQLRKVQCLWALSYDDHELIRKLYGGWALIEKVAATYTTATGGERPKVEEILIRPVKAGRGSCGSKFVPASDERMMLPPVAAPVSERCRTAALRVEVSNVRAHGGDRRSQSRAKLALETRTERAARAGIGRETQRKIDWLALNAPELLEKVRSGEMSAHRAYRQGREDGVLRSP